jgi:hypothetical protein
MIKDITIYLCSERNNTKPFDTVQSKVLDHFSLRSNINFIFNDFKFKCKDITDKEYLKNKINNLKKSDVMLFNFEQNKNEYCYDLMYFSSILKKPVIGWCNNMEEVSNDKMRDILVDICFDSLDKALDHISLNYI